MPSYRPAGPNPMSIATQAQNMARNCKDEKLAMTLQYVALGSMLLVGRSPPCTW